MIITYASGKSGIGKSTGALATAGLLARFYRVAFADLDPDCYATTMGLGKEAHADPLLATATPIVHPLLAEGPLCLYPGGDAMDAASEATITRHLQRCAAAADIVVVDTPPDRRRPTVLAALRAATVVVIPIVPEYQALAGFEKLLETCRALGTAARVRALLSRWEPRTLLAQDVQRDLVSAHPGAVLSVAIPRDQRAAEAPAVGFPVTLSAPRSPAAIAYRTAVHELAASGGMRIPKETI